MSSINDLVLTGQEEYPKGTHLKKGYSKSFLQNKLTSMLPL